MRKSLLVAILLSTALAGCGKKESPPGPGVGSKPPAPGQTGSLTGGQPPGGLDQAGGGAGMRTLGGMAPGTKLPGR